MHHIKTSTLIKAVGNKPKLINEFIGLVNSKTTSLSMAKMQSPSGWEEPGQTPEFDEYTYVIKGELHVKTKDGEFDIKANEVFFAPKNEWVQYSTPHEEGAEYLAVCLPAFSPLSVHRD